MGAGGRFNPWRALRARPELTLAWGHVGGAAALLEESGRIILDRRLGRRARAAALSHELIHAERGILYDSTTPTALVDREEYAVDHEVARRLVPPDELDAIIDLRDEVTVELVAEEFDCADWVAERALRQAEQRRFAPNHPVFRR